MTRSRFLALLIAVAIGLAAGWIAKQVVRERPERTEHAPLDLRKQPLHGEPPPRQYDR